MSLAQITIVIPTLNRLELVKQAITGALAQTVPVEIIVSDNGSIDGTDIYFREQTLPQNVRYFHFDTTIPVQNHGAFLRDKVLTDWVVFLSDDDELEPTFAERCLELIERYPDLIFVYSGAYLIYHDVLRPGKFGPEVETAANFLFNFMRGQRNICMCATLFRIADMRAIPPQPPDRFIGDMYYWVRLLSQGGKIGCVGQHLSKYFFYRPQMTNETGRTNVLQWHSETHELAHLMAETILADPAYASNGALVHRIAARYVALSTILQVVWNALRNVPRKSLLSSLLYLAPSLCQDKQSTFACLVYGVSALILPRPLLLKAVLWHIQFVKMIDANDPP